MLATFHKNQLLQKILSILSRYTQLDAATKYRFAAQFTLQGVHVSFFLLLNFYMTKEGFKDYEIVELWAYRFAAVMLLAFPIGLYIKGRRLKPFFWAAAVLVPVSSFGVIYSIGAKLSFLMYFSALIWGVGYACMQTCVQPFVLLNTKKEYHSEGFSLAYLSFSSMIFVEGIIFFILSSQFPVIVNERNFLLVICLLSFMSLFFRFQNQIGRKPFL